MALGVWIPNGPSFTFPSQRAVCQAHFLPPHIPLHTLLDMHNFHIQGHAKKPEQVLQVSDLNG